MHNILITKNLAYGVGGTTPVNMANLTTLQTGALAVVADNKRVLAADGSDAEGVKSFQIIVGITKNAEYGISTQVSVPIFTDYITDINVEKYNAPVVQVVDVGPFPLITDTAVGEIGLNFNNNSYIRTIQTDQLRINEYKKASVTQAAILQKIVDRINNGTGLPNLAQYHTFMTASLTGTTNADRKIRLTMKSEYVDFTMSAYGLAEDVLVVTSTKPVLSKGKGVDVRRAEDEYSGYLGNAGYGWRNELYYSKPLEADPAGTYDIVSIQFTGMHDTPQNKVRAASNWLQIAIPTGSELTETLQLLLATMVPKYKPSQDQFNETDGNPAGPAGTDPAPEAP
jgi:hypothetical protein